jgi:putative membrane protein
MQDLARQFLSDEDRRRIQSAVQEAERRTSGEIVPMVVSASYTYPMADVIFAAVSALPVAIALAHGVGSRFWIGGQNLWLFLGFFALAFALFHGAARRWPALKRLFISGREMDEEVEEAAVTRFFTEGLYRTREETGVLIFISVFERRVWVLADRGIDAKVEQEQWQEPVRIIVDGIRQRRQADAVCEAVAQVGNILREHFPVDPGDSDELRNLIVEE